jgi:hypothetical protein
MTVQAVPHRGLLIGISVIALVSSSLWIANTRARADEPSATPVVYIVTGVNFPDALGVGPASALNGGPILFVKQTSIPTPTKNELSRLKPDQIVVVGGTAVISASVESQLRAWAPVSRIAGANRYETGALVSRAAFPAPVPPVVDAFSIEETWENPYFGDGFALEMEIYVDLPSQLVISAQASLDTSETAEDATFDVVYCAVAIDEPDPGLAIPGSWRYPAISFFNPLPTCATQATTFVDTGYHTVTLNTVEMDSTTSVIDRNLIVTIIPIPGYETMLSASELEGPATVPSG